MRRLVDLVKISRLDTLIRRKATGSPDELARRLDLSRSSLFDIISYLRDEMQAPIRYNKDRPSYEYEYPPKFHLGFEEDRLFLNEMLGTVGGVNDISENNESLKDKNYKYGNN